MKKRVYKLIAGLLMVTMIIALVGCKETSPDPVAEPSSQAEESSVKQPEESSKPEASAPEAPEKEDPVEFAKKILADNANISETELRVQLYKAGYTAAEIKTAVETVMPKEEIPDKQESSKPEESSKPAESGESSESSKTEESSKQEESSKNEESKQTEDQNQESEESKSGSDTNESSKQEESSKQQESSKTESSSQQQQESSKPQESSKTEESSKQEESKTESATQQQQQESQTSTCDHEWVDVTEVVHHDAVTEQVWVVDEAAWDETVEKTETREVSKCKCRCGLIFDTVDEFTAHSIYYEDDENEWDKHTGWTSVTVTEEVVVGTETIHHDEVGHYETRTVTEAYDETVVTGQKCSKCGATK